MKSKKRILSVKVKRISDTSPDTSYLGEYSRKPNSEYSIDRTHSEDCASVVPVNAEGVQKLRNARAYIVDLQTATAYKWPINTADSQEWKDLEDAYNVLDTLADETPECDCGGHRVSSRELPYFNPPFENYKGESPEDIRKYCRQDYDRMESLNNGNWGYIGIRAEAEVQVSDVVQDITSGGLWGIESDSDKSYLAEIDAEELASLKSELLALGFSRRAISQAFKSAVEVSE